MEKFYTPPTDSVFDELKSIAIELWKTYDDTHWYASEKVDHIRDLKNTSTNFILIFQMFDIINQSKIISRASDDLIEALNSCFVYGKV